MEVIRFLLMIWGAFLMPDYWCGTGCVRTRLCAHEAVLVDLVGFLPIEGTWQVGCRLVAGWLHAADALDAGDLAKDAMERLPHRPVDEGVCLPCAFDSRYAEGGAVLVTVL